MHLCSSWAAGLDGESYAFGWARASTCGGDYCATNTFAYNNSLSSVDTKATYTSSNSYHDSYGDVYDGGS